VEVGRIAEKWIKGATILDPGCGSGSLSLAIIRKAVSAGFRPAADDLARICCIDRDAGAIEVFRSEVLRNFGLSMPEGSLINQDYLLKPPGFKADIVFSNPPWVSFNDLDDEDKTAYKPVFRNSGLTPDPRNLLLGGARIDIAALFVATALNRDTAENGEGCFFLPLSLLCGEGAHRAFRRLKLPCGRYFALTHVWKAGNQQFPGAGTAWCFAIFKSDLRQSWPVLWHEATSSGTWKELSATPVGGVDGPLVPYEHGGVVPSFPVIEVPAGSVPRQGANSGGAPAAFIIEEMGNPENGIVEVTGYGGHHGRLPVNLIHPLMSPGCFKIDNHSAVPVPERWIFLPYKPCGRVMSAEEIARYPDLVRWLAVHRQVLQNRKGTMLGRYCTQGIWWAVLGVGPYAFAPYKVGWEAYGKKQFSPGIFRSNGIAVWQGNQALHAYIPFSNSTDAERALESLRRPDVEKYLEDLGGAGTMSWAQPGRIRRLLSIKSPDGT
jgi:hypothetical protein